MSRKAVFLDLDGTLVVDVPYNVDPERVRLMPDCVDGLRRLHQAGYALFVTANQPGVALGMFPENALLLVEHAIHQHLTAVGVQLAGFRYCPHHPHGREARFSLVCRCRKPAPGLLQDLARDKDVALAESWAVGDLLHDVEAGHRAGARAVHINNGHETEWVMTPLRQPDAVAPHINAAADAILAAARTRAPAPATRPGERG
ncbi:MAG: HAD-IIIA family hydrolase [Myxococcota bacterium]